MISTPAFVELLPSIVGQQLKYIDLCRALDLKPKSSDSKTKQLKDIGLYCDIQEVIVPGSRGRGNTTRYVVHEVYDEAQLPIHANNKFQAPIEALIFSILKANNYRTLYYTNSQLLECLNMVNENYRFIKNPSNRKLLASSDMGADDTNMIYNGASKSGEILMKWADRALKNMDDRGFILYRHGFCLVLSDVYTGRKTIFNVPLDSDMERIVLGCYRAAYEELGLKFEPKRRWVPNGLKPKFYDAFDEALKNNQQLERMFHSQHLVVAGGYRANVITPNGKDIEATLNQYNNTIINTEAQRKIHTTKQLNQLTGDQRNRLIQEIIATPPSVRYYELIESSKNSPRD